MPTAIGLAAAEIATQTLTSNPFAWNNYATSLGDLGLHQEALAAYDRAIALDPTDAGAHSNRGNALTRLGRHEEALAACDQAIALDPSYADTHINRGIALAVVGDFDQALTDFNTADRIEPDGGGEGRAWAGGILWHRRDPVAARDQFALVQGRVVGYTPFHAAEIEAIALCGLGRPADAEQHLRRALPQRTAGDAAEPRAIYDLLSDPPLTGIHQLRVMSPIVV